METKKFKTTMKCAGCLATATDFLDEAIGKNKWTVDILDPGKTLSIAPGVEVKDEVVIEALKKAGFKAERVVNS